MKKLLNELTKRNIPGASLSADVRNPATRLYERMGFTVVTQEENSLVMLKRFD